jgi:hypothetical protein
MLKLHTWVEGFAKRQGVNIYVLGDGPVRFGHRIVVQEGMAGRTQQLLHRIAMTICMEAGIVCHGAEECCKVIEQPSMMLHIPLRSERYTS